MFRVDKASKAHLQRYCTEFDFRYNTRKLNDFERAETALLGAVGKRLTYRRTVVAASQGGEAKALDSIRVQLRQSFDPHSFPAPMRAGRY